MLSEFVEAFRFLARTPGAGHKREDLTANQSILFWPVRDFVVIYRMGTRRLEIAMIVRGSRDIPTLLRRRGL
jgi:plasmid stabilization system protein ParE